MRSCTTRLVAYLVNPPFLIRSYSDQLWHGVFGNKLTPSPSVALSGEDRRPPYQEDPCWIVLHANWPLAAAGASHRAAEAAASSSHAVALRLPISPHFEARPVAAKGFRIGRGQSITVASSGGAVAACLACQAGEQTQALLGW